MISYDERTVLLIDTILDEEDKERSSAEKLGLGSLRNVPAVS